MPTNLEKKGDILEKATGLVQLSIRHEDSKGEFVQVQSFVGDRDLEAIVQSLSENGADFSKLNPEQLAVLIEWSLFVRKQVQKSVAKIRMRKRVKTGLGDDLFQWDVNDELHDKIMTVAKSKTGLESGSEERGEFFRLADLLREEAKKMLAEESPETDSSEQGDYEQVA